MELSSISDTAFWVAQYRADETLRPDALFKDPFAARLVGKKGEEFRKFIDAKNEISWPLVTRTYLFDMIILDEIKSGVDMVISLAAGLDTRPYRLDLPSNLKWVEIDLPAIIDYKVDSLSNEKPVCGLERIALDLSQIDERNKVFKRLNGEAKNILVVTEGLLVYMDPEEVKSLSGDLSICTHFNKWINDIASPGLIQMMIKRSGDKLRSAAAPFKFGPEEGPLFFATSGWSKDKVYSILRWAAKFKRVGFFMRMLAKLPQPEDKQGSRPWSGVCVLTNDNYNSD